MEAENIAEKKEPKRLSVWACIILYMIGFIVCAGLLTTLVRIGLSITLGVEARHPGVMGDILLEAATFLGILLPAALMLRIERRPFSELGLSVKGHVRGLWYGLLLAVVLFGVGFGLSVALGEVEVDAFQFDPWNLLTSFVFFLLVALAEETMIRGYVLGHLLYTRLNKFWSLFISSVLFALMHLFNPNIDFFPMLNLVLAGLMLGASYLYTRNLCFPISLHLFWNWIQGPILGYQVSGESFGKSMLTIHSPEENIVNGGAFGFEGSLICTVLMIILTILIIWWGEKREAISLAVPQSC